MFLISKIALNTVCNNYLKLKIINVGNSNINDNVITSCNYNLYLSPVATIKPDERDCKKTETRC